MRHLIRVLLVCLVFAGHAIAQTHEQPDVAQQDGSGNGYTPQHPMDALTPEEIGAGVALLRKEGLASDSTRFPVFTLKELPKADVMAWQPGQPFDR